MIAQNIENIQNELPQGVKLVAVSKFQPLEAVLEAYVMGQRCFGENRPQEFAAKAVQMPQDVEWHFIGHLQTNKLKLVLPYAHIVESIDTVHLLEAVNNWGALHDKVINVLLEVHIGAEETKQGFTPAEVLDLLDSICSCRHVPSQKAATLGGLEGGAQTPGLGGTIAQQSLLTGGAAGGCYPFINFCGLMGMASHVDEEEAIAADFERIKNLFDECRERFPQLKDFTQLSIGMSGDWRIALRHGSTEVRIGTAIFGSRNY